MYINIFRSEDRDVAYNRHVAGQVAPATKQNHKRIHKRLSTPIALYQSIRVSFKVFLKIIFKFFYSAKLKNLFNALFSSIIFKSITQKIKIQFSFLNFLFSKFNKNLICIEIFFLLMIKVVIIFFFPLLLGHDLKTQKRFLI